MSLIGLVLALIAILGGNMIEGGHPSALLDLPAFLIVIGGTIGAALTQCPFSVVGSTLKRFKWLLSPLKLDMQEQAQLLETLAGNARRSGMLALEGMIEEIKDPFLKKGVQMMVDGYEKNKIHEVLENEIEFEQEDLEQTVKFYEAMGGYCPTMGIVGAVFGLLFGQLLKFFHHGSSWGMWGRCKPQAANRSRRALGAQPARNLR